MDLIPDVIIIILFLILATYFIVVKIDHDRWVLDKYDALFYYSNKFFKKRGYEICKIDLVNKGDYKGKTQIHSPFLQQEQFVRKIIIMDASRKKFVTLVKIKRSTLLGTSIKILKKEQYTE